MRQERGRINQRQMALSGDDVVARPYAPSGSFTDVSANFDIITFEPYL